MMMFVTTLEYNYLLALMSSTYLMTWSFFSSSKPYTLSNSAAVMSLVAGTILCWAQKFMHAWVSFIPPIMEPETLMRFIISGNCMTLCGVVSSPS